MYNQTNSNRKAAYENNLKMVEEWNANPSNSFKLTINAFSDKLSEEITPKRTTTNLQSSRLNRPTASATPVVSYSYESYPSSLSNKNIEILPYIFN